MFNRNHVSVLAMLASISVLSFTACGDDAVSNPAPVATESSAIESSSSVAISSSESFSSEGVSRPKSSNSSGMAANRVDDLPECKADNRNRNRSYRIDVFVTLFCYWPRNAGLFKFLSFASKI